MNEQDDLFDAILENLAVERMYESAKVLRARDTDQREALARVEAERDVYLADWVREQHGNTLLQAQLAEAVGFFKALNRSRSYSGMLNIMLDVQEFLARHAQAEQQEARDPVLARPERGVSLDEALALTMDRYGGAMEKLAAIEQQEAQGAQAGDEQDQVHQLAFEAGEPDEDGDGYHFSAEQLDEFVSKLTRAAQPAAHGDES